MLVTILSFAVVAGVIITIHELGHFCAARLTGMRVKKFSIGFPPKMFTKKVGDTEYSLSWIPLGGYVQIAGMVDESLDPEGMTGAPDEFNQKNFFQKVFVLSAGVMMNYLTAFLIVIGLTLVMGVPEIGTSQIGEVIEGRPAQQSGLLSGDKIVEVNGETVATWEDVIRTISAAEDTLYLTIVRDEARVAFVVPTMEITEGDSTRRVIGIGPAIDFRPAGLGDAVAQSASFCYTTTVGLVGFIGDMVTGKGSLEQLSGPVGVAKLSGDSARQGPGAFIFFIAFVSVSIGFLNILPFPVLDGGHILFVVIEAVIRRPVPIKAKLVIQQIGIVALVLLVLIVSYNDVVRIIAN
ncbi:M50 family metallopeptidase, partial [bacterium]|nr:M50 family metallopeptidase [bacterium]